MTPEHPRWRPDSCTCHWAVQSLGRLYGISMGKGWVRLDTSPDCPDHGALQGEQ